ncbi:MAG: chorismate-binding protein [Spirochaetaceae bacterium]|jgi:anthranilate synthase component 1|nr:chorismate-binding protein [Spirochaetaceae bacterium]
MPVVTLDALEPFASQYPLLPVWEGRPVTKTPVEAFKKFKNVSRQCFILESLEDKERWGRWTFLGFEPKLELSCKNGVFRVKNGTQTEMKIDNPAREIEKILAQYASPSLSGIAATGQIPAFVEELPPFAGGFVGYFAFDFVKYAEPSLRALFETENKPSHFKDCDLMLFDKIIVWDNMKSLCYFIVNIKTGDLKENYNRALSEIERLERILDTGADAYLPPLRITSPFREQKNKEQYCEMAVKAKQYIHEGDIFQAVLSNQLEAEAEGSLFGAYVRLREANPSPYMFHLASSEVEISGASPETLVRLSGKNVWTFPLAGTRPRGGTPEEDAALERELLADPKERAEHTMLVDLGRNDMGRLCEFNSVTVERSFEIQRFSHVMHIGSTVRGIVRNDVRALDCIAAALPAGTLSGAPKIRAIEIINELENSPRGIYGGAIGYIAFSGDMDTCIGIRIAYKKDGRIFVRSGAGIVADSAPENEYEECRNKMRAVVAAVEDAAEK